MRLKLLCGLHMIEEEYEKDQKSGILYVNFLQFSKTFHIEEILLEHVVQNIWNMFKFTERFGQRVALK